jgi:hypothetical protein
MYSCSNGVINSNFIVDSMYIYMHCVQKLQVILFDCRFSVVDVADSVKNTLLLICCGRNMKVVMLSYGRWIVKELSYAFKVLLLIGAE